MTAELSDTRLARSIAWLKRRLPRLIVEGLILLALVLAFEWWLTRDAVRGVAPPIQADTVAGVPFSLDRLRGRPVLVYFWATWCPVCRAEQGAVEAVAQDWPIITIAMQSGSEEEVRAFLSEEGLSFPVINDPERAIAARYGVQAVPAAFVLDSEGDVRFVARGYTTGWGLRLRLLLADWL